jgi:hypothetical protein
MFNPSQLAAYTAAYLRSLRIRRGIAQALDLLGLAVIVAGCDRIAGRGVAEVVAGVLLVLLAFEVDRR